MAHFIHITEIDWDTHDEDNDEFINPEEAGLPSEVLIEADEKLYSELMEDPDDCLSNYLSDKFGCCDYGFNFTVHQGYGDKVKEIIDRIGEENILG